MFLPTVHQEVPTAGFTPRSSPPDCQQLLQPSLHPICANSVGQSPLTMMDTTFSTIITASRNVSFPYQNQIPILSPLYPLPEQICPMPSLLPLRLGPTLYPTVPCTDF